ncbi:F-box domain-containing protein [Strongyloides ratti]|uniref:F-box domain-containing protein n=1 Tax=Strongyloides ratti TaxID=34506 RepID=A0A090LNE9_STRRB|nr:F-box domain-containing protein [Strongyloides ratti]CEF69060.1 F-box domain-containing protein [Strongyloides ratti]
MLKLFRKESLLRKLSNNKKNSSQRCIVSYNIKNEYSQFIPLPILHINTIEDISDKCIIEILKRMDYNDILNMRLVNKRISKIIQRHYGELNIKKIKEIIFVGLGEDKCYRLNQNIFSLSFDEQFKYGVLIENVSKYLKYIKVTQTVSLENLNFSNLCYKIFRRLCESSVHELLLTNCTITMNYEIFSSLLKTFYLSNVTIKHCKLDDCQLLSDHLFILNLQLRKFKFFSFDKKIDYIYAPLLSNRTLITWAENSSWPEIILLQGVKSNFNHIGIEILLDAFHEYSCKMDKSFTTNNIIKNTNSLHWDFGFIRCQLSQLIAILRKYNYWIRFLNCTIF